MKGHSGNNSTTYKTQNFENEKSPTGLLTAYKTHNSKLCLTYYRMFKRTAEHLSFSITFDELIHKGGDFLLITFLTKYIAD